MVQLCSCKHSSKVPILSSITSDFGLVQLYGVCTDQAHSAGPHRSPSGQLLVNSATLAGPPTPRQPAKEQTAQTDGPLRVCNEFDACDACMRLDLSAWEMARELGTFKLVHAPRDKDAPGPAITRLRELDEFAGSLKKGQVQAVPSNSREVGLEGRAWLVLLLGKATLAPTSAVFATDGYEAGWWIVDGHYFELVQKSPRAYRLQKRKRCLVVNAFVRLPAPVQFDLQRRSPRLASDSTSVASSAHLTGPVESLGDAKYYAIENCMGIVP